MKLRTLFAANIALLLAVTCAVRAAEMTRFDARSGSKVRIEGTSTMHDWQMEGKLIGGFISVGPNFPTEPGQTVQPGKVEAHVEAFIPARSLQSLKKDGKPYSTSMDDIVYDKLKEPTNKKILYYLTELVLKEPAKSKEAPYVFDSKGDLVVAGVTNNISMPVNVLPLGDKKLKITGNTTVKMTSFGIEPPAPKLAMGAIKTGDDVKVIIDWTVAQRAAPAAAASK
jgi:hypothetical protein